MITTRTDKSVWLAAAVSVVAVLVVVLSGAAWWMLLPLLAVAAAWGWALHRLATPELGPALQGKMERTLDAASGDLRLLRNNLKQVRMLVQDATETIGQDFHEINVLARRHHQILMQSGAYDLEPATSVEIATMSAEIGRRIESLVVSIQFGDIVSQLLEFTDRQAVEVEEYLDSLSEIYEGDEHGPHLQRAESVAVDDTMKRALRQPLRLSDGMKPTAQTSMRSGDIELF